VPHALAGRRPDGPADLHLHSTCSDGLLRPAELAAEVAAAGIAVASLTDHDTLEGWPEFEAACREHGVVAVPGVEISTRHPTAGERHVLGYGVDPGCPALGRTLERSRSARRDRAAAIVDVLRDLGVPLALEAVLEEAAGASVGRPHVADALVRAGLAGSRQEAFERWLGDGRPAALPRRDLAFGEAVALVHEAGGVAVLAHPSRTADVAALPAFVAAGLDGLEAWHPSLSEADRALLAGVARQHRLLLTGGSDNHGDAKGLEVMRSCRVPGHVARDLETRLREHPGRPSTRSRP